MSGVLVAECETCLETRPVTPDGHCAVCAVVGDIARFLMSVVIDQTDPDVNVLYLWRGDRA